MSKREQRKNKQYHPRMLQGRSMRQSFMIYCEGDTEVGYFGSFKKRAKRLPSGNALTLVQAAIVQKNASKTLSDQYWVVFDKDDSTDNQFDLAISLAIDNNIHVAWSNQAFELWFILHYRSFNHICNRNNYESVLRQYLPDYRGMEKGEEQGKKLFRQTNNLLNSAIVNARNGYESFEELLAESQKESSTQIYLLIEEIVKNS